MGLPFTFTFANNRSVTLRAMPLLPWCLTRWHSAFCRQSLRPNKAERPIVTVVTVIWLLFHSSVNRCYTGLSAVVDRRPAGAHLGLHIIVDVSSNLSDLKLIIEDCRHLTGPTLGMFEVFGRTGPPTLGVAILDPRNSV